jgi:uncharacterized protein (DUF924 family)
MSRTEDDEADDITLPPPPADWAAQLLRFWFDEHGYQDWFRGGDAFDAAVREHFGEWHAALRGYPADHFLTDADTALAAVILFDQVPRNIHRGSAEAFATDTLALAVARGAVTRGLDRSFGKEQRMFLYLPFEHSENIDDQRESLRLMGSLDDADLLDYAQKHFAIIEQFGRFPHRNAVLGRADRPGEEAAIAEGSHW